MAQVPTDFSVFLHSNLELQKHKLGSKIKKQQSC